ncbi:MAG TPA: ribonuclease III [Pseudogracilibacillus sp.]|nr:ribonuclease III [Pseudogracilibacillus sp.]
MNPRPLTELEKELNVSFRQTDLLRQAFTHSSYVNEHHKEHVMDNERLEFLGDAVLELAVSDFLYHKKTEMPEGEMTRLRANIVCEESLYRFSNELHLQEYVMLGKGEEHTGGRQRQALLADVFEAFLGAMYIDQGMDLCQQFLEKNIFPLLENDAYSYVMDYKTKLQEMVQKEKDGNLFYQITDEKGPAHDKEFSAEVIVNDTKKAIGKGRTKKTAEQFAAKAMIEKIQRI